MDKANCSSYKDR